MLCILTSFRLLVELLFFSCFQPFLFILSLFQWFHAWNQQKPWENKQKKLFFSFIIQKFLNYTQTVTEKEMYNTEVWSFFLYLNDLEFVGHNTWLKSKQICLFCPLDILSVFKFFSPSVTCSNIPLRQLVQSMKRKKIGGSKILTTDLLGASPTWRPFNHDVSLSLPTIGQTARWQIENMTPNFSSLSLIPFWVVRHSHKRLKTTHIKKQK